MIIALIVLSSILLFLVLGLIFKKDFRTDVLKAGNENEADIKGVKIKGALFWVLYALTAVGTIYLALQFQNAPAPDCEPKLIAENSDHWIALDANTATPVVLRYGCSEHTSVDDHSDKNIDMKLQVNNQLQIAGSGGGKPIGTLDKASLLSLNLTNVFSIDEYLEIYYKLNLQPFSSTRKASDFYDWNGYENLPFTLAVNYSQNRQVHVKLASEKNPPAFAEKYLSLEKWDQHLYLDNLHYVIRLRSRDLDINNDIEEHVNFQILKFRGRIEGLQ